MVTFHLLDLNDIFLNVRSELTILTTEIKGEN